MASAMISQKQFELSSLAGKVGFSPDEMIVIQHQARLLSTKIKATAITVWGKVYGVEKDYILLRCYGDDLISKSNSYVMYSNDGGVNFRLLDFDALSKPSCVLPDKDGDEDGIDKKKKSIKRKEGEESGVVEREEREEEEAVGWDNKINLTFDEQLRLNGTLILSSADIVEGYEGEDKDDQESENYVVIEDKFTQPCSKGTFGGGGGLSGRRIATTALLCSLITGPYIGDPSYEYRVINPTTNLLTPLKESERLAWFVRACDNECRVVPRGSVLAQKGVGSSSTGANSNAISVTVAQNEPPPASLGKKKTGDENTSSSGRTDVPGGTMSTVAFGQVIETSNLPPWNGGIDSGGTVLVQRPVGLLSSPQSKLFHSLLCIVQNKTFEGLDREVAGRTDYYYHLRRPQRLRTALEIESAIHNVDFLESISEDFPSQVWSVKYDPSLDAVYGVNLKFNGNAIFYHVPQTKIYGSLYIGDGNINRNLAFML